WHGDGDGDDEDVMMMVAVVRRCDGSSVGVGGCGGVGVMVWQRGEVVMVLMVVVAVAAGGVSSMLQHTIPIPTPPIITTAPSVTTIILDLLPVIVQRLSDLEKQFEAWKQVDHSKAIEESVQANIINKVKNQLPKFLPKVASDVINPRIESIVRDALQKNPTFLAQPSFTPSQSAYKAAESLYELELKNILFEKIDKS
ncbi:hypothetical protein Tco_0900631, partial [Tanacetum coccineum]